MATQKTQDGYQNFQFHFFTWIFSMKYFLLSENTLKSIIIHKCMYACTCIYMYIMLAKKNKTNKLSLPWPSPWHSALCLVIWCANKCASVTKVGAHTANEGGKENIITREPTEKVNQNFCFSSVYPVAVSDHCAQRGERRRNRRDKMKNRGECLHSPSLFRKW